MLNKLSYLILILFPVILLAKTEASYPKYRVLGILPTYETRLGTRTEGEIISFPVEIQGVAIKAQLRGELKPVLSEPEMGKPLPQPRDFENFEALAQEFKDKGYCKLPPMKTPFIFLVQSIENRFKFEIPNYQPKRVNVVMFRFIPSSMKGDDSRTTWGSYACP